MSEQNPWLDKSDAEVERQLALLLQAKEAKGAVLDIAAAAAIKWGIKRLKGTKEGESKLGNILDSVSASALPKEANLAKPAGLSETQVDLIKANVEKALNAIKLG